MSVRMTEGGVARRRGGFSPRMAALSALTGLAIGLALVQAGPWRDDTTGETPAPSAVVAAPTGDVAPPEGVAALTGGEGLYFTERQVQAARARPAAEAPPLGTAASTGGEGEFFTEQRAVAARTGGDTTCGVRVDQAAC